MISLAFVFQNLTNERPDLDGGIYSYAQAGFGDFIGFASAWGYWFSAFLGNVAYATLLMSSVGNFFPLSKVVTHSQVYLLPQFYYGGPLPYTERCRNCSIY